MEPLLSRYSCGKQSAKSAATQVPGLPNLSRNPTEEWCTYWLNVAMKISRQALPNNVAYLSCLNINQNMGNTQTAGICYHELWIGAIGGSTKTKPINKKLECAPLVGQLSLQTENGADDHWLNGIG